MQITRELLRSKGIAGLYKGLGATILRYTHTHTHTHKHTPTHTHTHTHTTTHTNNHTPPHPHTHVKQTHTHKHTHTSQNLSPIRHADTHHSCWEEASVCLSVRDVSNQIGRAHV